MFSRAASPTGRNGGLPARLAAALLMAGASPEKQMAKPTFAEQIKHPNWQKKRLEVMEAAGWRCENCGATSTTLNVHHKQYIKGRMYWEYERHELECLCENCHKAHHEMQDGLKAMLAEVDLREAFALIAGFHHASDWVNEDNKDQARSADALAYAAGLVAYLAAGLEIDKIYRVAEFAASLANPHAETRMVFMHNSDGIFGREA